MRVRNLFIVGLAFFTLGNFAKSETIYGLTNFQQIVTFDSVTKNVTSTTSLPGFGVSGEQLAGIDVRPLTGELYGISLNRQVYAIDPISGATTAIGLPIGGTGGIRGLDFNPTVDRIRVITSTNENFRLFPTIALAGGSNLVAATDTPLAFAGADTNAGDTANIVGFAYTNSFPGSTSTTLYDLDAFNDVLTTQIPPNNGTLNTIGSLGFDVVSSGGFTGFDISGQTGLAYLVGNNLFGGGGLTTNSLYTVNLATGAAILSGPITGILGGTLRDVAVVAVPEPSTFLLVGAAFGAIGLYRRKK